MRAYSEDLRKKIVESYLNGEGTLKDMAERFKVAQSFVIKLLKQYRETGNVRPKEYVRGPKARFTEDNLNQLKQLVGEKNDSTLNELVKNLKERYGVIVSKSTVDRSLGKLGLTRKKRLFTQKKKIPNEFKQ